MLETPRYFTDFTVSFTLTKLGMTEGRWLQGNPYLKNTLNGKEVLRVDLLQFIPQFTDMIGRGLDRNRFINFLYLNYTNPQCWVREFVSYYRRFNSFSYLINEINIFKYDNMNNVADNFITYYHKKILDGNSEVIKYLADRRIKPLFNGKPVELYLYFIVTSPKFIDTFHYKAERLLEC